MASSHHSRDNDMRRLEDERSEDRGRVRVPGRNISSDRVRSPIAQSRRARERESRTESFLPTPSSANARRRSVSPDKNFEITRDRRRISSPSPRREAELGNLSQRREPGGARTSQTHQHGHKSPSSAKRRHSIVSSTSRPSDRQAKRQRSASKERGSARARRTQHSQKPSDRSISPYSSQPVPSTRRRSPETYHSQARRRSRSADHHPRAGPRQPPRRQSPETSRRARAEHRDTRDRYGAPEHSGTRRRTPSPRAGYGEETFHNRRYEEYHGTRYTKPARRTSPRRRSPSPSDLISALATRKRTEDSKADKGHQNPSRDRSLVRRLSRSPRGERFRQDLRDDPYYIERERGRDPRVKYRDEPEANMYGRGGPSRGHYQDPRYSQSPHYPQQHHYPPQGQSPYGRGGYPPQPAYGSHQGYVMTQLYVCIHMH